MLVSFFRLRGRLGARVAFLDARPQWTTGAERERHRDYSSALELPSLRLQYTPDMDRSAFSLTLEGQTRELCAS